MPKKQKKSSYISLSERLKRALKEAKLRPKEMVGLSKPLQFENEKPIFPVEEQMTDSSFTPSIIKRR